MEMVIQFVNELIMFLRGIGPVGGFFLVFLESFIPPLPLAVFVGLNMKSFGLVWGFIISYAGAMAGGFFTYLICYYLGDTKFVKNIVHRKGKVSYYAERLKKIKPGIFALLVGTPFLPSVVFNSASGLVRMSKKRYLIGAAIGKFILIIFWGYVGTSLIDSLTNINVLISLIIVFISAYYVSKLISKKLNVE